MNGYLIALIIVLWFLGVFGLFWLMDEFGPLWLVPLVAWLVLGLGYICQLALEDEASGPCLRYETSYVLVGNVMTPYRYCVERGKWTEPHE